MWLVLCEPGDLAGLWAYQGLKDRGFDPVELVCPQILVSSRRWEHQLGVGGIRISILLHDERRLDGCQIRGVLNRVAYLQPCLFPQAASGDRLYATQEMTALFMSWLSALRAPVLNRPVSQGLCGSWRHPSEWATLAAQAGLEVFPYRQSSSAEIPVGARLVRVQGPVHTAFVVEGRRFVGCSVPDEFAEACIRLGALAGVGLLGLEFAAGAAGRWTFLGASPQPDLRLGGDALLDTLEQVFRGNSP